MSELPELITEFVDLSKAYLKQETIEPAKRLGRFAGFSIGAAVAFALAALFGGIALLRLLLDVLPEGPYWTVLGYVLAAIVLGLLAGVLVMMTKSSLAKKEKVV